MKAKEAEGPEEPVPQFILEKNMEDLPVEDLEKMTVSQLKSLSNLVKVTCSSCPSPAVS